MRTLTKKMLCSFLVSVFVFSVMFGAVSPIRANALENNIMSDTIVDITPAVNAVVKAEKYPTNRTYIVDALNKVNALPDIVPEKADLVARATALKDAFNKAIAEEEYQYNLKQSNYYVQQAEKMKTSYYISKAQDYINLLPAEDENRPLLQERLDAITFGISYSSAVSAVEKAERYRTTIYINSAQSKINALPNRAEKDILQERLNAVKPK